VSFLATLEMCRLHLMRVYESHEGTLWVMPRFDDPEAVLVHLEHLDEKVLYAG
jgi:hypothetical protein